MKTLMLGLFASLALFLGLPTANAAGSGSGAGVVVSFPVMYEIDNITNGGTTTNQTRLTADAHIGYKFTNPLYVGAVYSMDNLTYGSSSLKSNYTSYGAAIGAIGVNWYGRFDYYFSSTAALDQSTSNTNTYSNGSGYQFDLGYNFWVAPKFGIAPQISYRYLSYTSYKNTAGTTTNNTYSYTTVHPYISFMFLF